ncbi:hypothetical protein PW5551_08275 [Petrotoga sp. 9PW.55.5.1]|uniref:hypothetical protein n=1 Tax=Petrotoga sp. 9PW.55.5.1 TaxID=1308979 RepID=UPI000DC5DD61|nr:hypothetical protein [Petrotoga sp. 9PW.55.5.1]RAO98697.1 hypothetical protein PW5551_08275 [Petrotoga sp. 9PW.55.5.1]
MNIFELLNNFFEEDKTSKLSSSSIKLYIFLIYQANESLKTALKSQVILIDDLGTKKFNWINDKIRVITDEANRNQKKPHNLNKHKPKRTNKLTRIKNSIKTTINSPLERGGCDVLCRSRGVVADRVVGLIPLP